MAEQVSSLLRRSLGHLADEVPASYRLVLDRLGPLVIGLDIDAERFALSGGRHRLEVVDGGAAAATVLVSTSRATIVDLLDAEVGLAEAVDAGTVTVWGRLDDVQRAHDALLAYVHAAVRAPSQPGLLTALRTGAP